MVVYIEKIYKEQTMLFLGVLLKWSVPGWLVVVLWANFIIGAIVALMAFINWIGTDRSHEIYEADNNGYHLNGSDVEQLARYEKRSQAFVGHILLNLILGLLGWYIAIKSIYIPEE